MDLDAVAIEFGMHQGAEFRIDGRQHLGEHLDMGDGNASDGQPFGHLEPDVASADDEGGLGSDPVDDGMQPKRAPEILFACVHNAGHSQMAAEVSHAMKEVGISLDEEFPMPLTDEVVAAADVHHGLRRHLSIHPRPPVRGLAYR